MKYRKFGIFAKNPVTHDIVYYNRIKNRRMAYQILERLIASGFIVRFTRFKR